MSTTRRLSTFLGVALLVAATLFGCSLLLRDGSEQSGWHIKLNIGNPVGAKAIAVNEYDVTALAVELYDPYGELIEEISWQAADGQQAYLIPVSEQGQYEIFVTHISEEDGEIVEAEESALFNIQAMVITVIDIIPGCIGTINVEPGDEAGLTAEEIHEGAMAAMTALWDATAPLYKGSTAFPAGVTIDDSNFSDEAGGGILIVTFTNYTLPESEVTVNDEITLDITFPEDLLGTLAESISGSVSLSGLPGEIVDIDLIMTMEMEDAPFWDTLQWSGTITVDGQEADVDQVMTEWLAMVLEEVSLEDGTITVRVTGAYDHNDAYFYYAVGATGADLSDPSNWLGVAPTDPIIVGGTVECITVDVGTDDPATFTGGESYDVAGLIDVDLDSSPTSGDYIFGLETVVVDGDTTLRLVYPTDFTLVP